VCFFFGGFERSVGICLDGNVWRDNTEVQGM